MSTLGYRIATFLSYLPIVVALEFAFGWVHWFKGDVVAMVIVLVGTSVLARLIMIQDLLTKNRDQQ